MHTFFNYRYSSFLPCRFFYRQQISQMNFGLSQFTVEELHKFYEIATGGERHMTRRKKLRELGCNVPFTGPISSIVSQIKEAMAAKETSQTIAEESSSEHVEEEQSVEEEQHSEQPVEQPIEVEQHVEQHVEEEQSVEEEQHSEQPVEQPVEVEQSVFPHVSQIRTCDKIPQRKEEYKMQNTRTLATHFGCERPYICEVYQAEDKYVRPYFDVDDCKTDEDIDSALAWFKSLEQYFGPVSICGYTHNKEVADKYHLKYHEFTKPHDEYETLPNSSVKHGYHNISMHVIYYKSAVLGSDFEKIMNVKSAYKFPKFVDRNVYSLNTERKFRHSFCWKCYGFDSKGKVIGFDTTGSIIAGPNEFRSQFIHPLGGEKILSNEQLTNAFTSVLSNIVEEANSPEAEATSHETVHNTVTSHQSTGIITYGNCIYQKQEKCKTISYDNVSNIKFGTNPDFIEFIPLQPSTTVHPYMVFDTINTRKEYDDVIAWCDMLKSVFGEYSCGGCTTDSEMEELGFKFNDQLDQFLYMRVVFYQSRISFSDLKQIMYYTDKKGGFWKHEVNKHVSADYYNFKRSRIALPHVCSNLNYKPGHELNRSTAGSILNNLPKFSQLITPKGDEPLVERDEWIKVFPAKTTKTQQRYEEIEQRKTERSRKQMNNIKIDDIEIKDELIMLDDDEIDELLGNFEPEYNVLSTQLNALFSSPYPNDFVEEHINKWWGQRDHHNGNDAFSKFKMYYKQTYTNQWFFTILKHLPDDLRQQYRQQYWHPERSIDLDVNINTSTWDIFDIIEECKQQKYTMAEMMQFITKLRGVVGMQLGNKFYVKIRVGSEFTIQEMNSRTFTEALKVFKPFSDNSKISITSIVTTKSMFFFYRNVMPYLAPDNEDPNLNYNNTISLFQGFKYAEINDDDCEQYIKPFLDHIKNIICNERDVEEDKAKYYQYFMKWWACIFQRVTYKVQSMPVITGPQGTGKSLVCKTFAELIGSHALPNVDSIEKVFGRFNGLLGSNILTVINEPPNAADRFAFLGSIKSKITEIDTVQERKGIDSVGAQSFCNFILTTNSFLPIPDEPGNRRFIYFDTKIVESKEYYKKLFDLIEPQQNVYNPKFMGCLLHYMRTKIDISDFYAEDLIKEINEKVDDITNPQLQRQLTSLPPLLRFIVEHNEEFTSRNGMSCKNISIDGLSEDKIGKLMFEYCITKRPRVQQPDGLWKQVTHYKLKSVEVEPKLKPLYNLITFHNSREAVYNAADSYTDQE